MITLTMGIILALAATCIGWNQILVGPQAVNYPTAPFLPRLLMFAWAATLGYRSFDLLEGCVLGTPEKFPGSGIPATIFLFLAQAAILYVTLRQWLPAKVWRRIAQLLALARCGRNKVLEERRKVDAAAVRPGVPVDNPSAGVVSTALTELALSGMNVVGPNEGAQVVYDAPPPRRRSRAPKPDDAQD